jgi:hypothetical protein
MPLVNGNGPGWSRPLVKRAERRLSGLNPVLSFLAGVFRPRVGKRTPALSRPGIDEDDDGAASAGDGSPQLDSR